jgi:hypothetical protein
MYWYNKIQVAINFINTNIMWNTVAMQCNSSYAAAVISYHAFIILVNSNTLNKFLVALYKPTTLAFACCTNVKYSFP